MKAPETGRVAPRSVFGFIMPGLPITMLGLPLLIYLPNFYANGVGIELSLVGLVFLAIRSADFVIDPYLGVLMDRTRLRFGRFRAWFLGGMILMFGGTALLFFPPQGADVWYLLISLSVLYLGYSTALLAQMTWGSTLTVDYHERSRIYGTWQAANICGLLLSIIVPLVLAALGREGLRNSINGVGFTILVLIPLATVGILTLTPDRSGSMAVMGHRSARDTVRDIVRLMRRRVIARIMTIDFLLSAAAGVTGALFLFFFRSVKGFSVNEANLMLFAYFIGSLLGAPIWVRVSRRMGKHNALLLAASCYAVAQASQLFLPRGNAFVYIPWMLIAGLPYAAITFLLRAMMADAIDLVKLETGRDESGLLFGFLGSTNKLAYGMAVGIMYPLLQFIGFDASEAASNGSAVLTSVSALYIVPTALLVLGGVAALTNYPLPARLHDEISRKLAERTAAAA